MANRINYKINIDKTRNKYYNKTEIEIFTYKEHLLYESFINERVYGLQEEPTTYKMINNKIHNEHDKIFRKILDNRQEAVNFINKTLKLEIKEESLEKYNSSFITNDLINQESDVIYKLKNTNDNAYNEQLKGYRDYIKTKTTKSINLYLYSLLDGKFFEIV